MKKNILIICIVALIVGIIGFVIGINFNGKDAISGTYKTTTWNGKDAVLVLNDDNTMIHPNGYKGTYTLDLENNKIEIEYEYEINKYNDDGTTRIETQKGKQEATIVPNGLMINTHFFEKID